MRFRGSKAAGSFCCDKEGSFELLVHCEADSTIHSYAEFNFGSVLSPHEAELFGDIAAYFIRHAVGLFVICVEPSTPRPTRRYRRLRSKADETLARRSIWLFTTTIEDLRRDPYWLNACEIARCAQADLTYADQSRIIDFLALEGQAAIMDCARRCRSSLDSCDAVLRLVSSGILAIDADTPLTTASLVRLQSGAPSGSPLTWL
ncbi:hypothetical protein [Bosea sp. 685]|uniref:hypothetical protein n=1 Tax=Bosea sp. 685 TaxID=3080057 RepID=UPI0028931508|nr:hypothetical protein [Bosea sp. 685]WNJ89572.1 hypothetical protein RMR04_24690 [Bosea sp. 685]